MFKLSNNSFLKSQSCQNVQLLVEMSVIYSKRNLNFQKLKFPNLCVIQNNFYNTKKDKSAIISFAFPGIMLPKVRGKIFTEVRKISRFFQELYSKIGKVSTLEKIFKRLKGFSCPSAKVIIC